MSNRKNPNIDLGELLMNLRDLDDISRRVSKEMDKKNQILENGLLDCKVCRSYIDKNQKSKNTIH